MERAFLLKKQILAKLYFSVFILLCMGCDPSEHQPPSIVTEVNTPEQVFEGTLSNLPLPEPVIGTPTNHRFTLTQLPEAEPKDQVFKISDDIMFPNASAEQKKYLKNLNLKISTHCVSYNKQLISKEFERKWSAPAPIPLIELLPQKALLPGKAPHITCSFNVMVMNPDSWSESATLDTPDQPETLNQPETPLHYFTLKSMAIEDRSEHRFIKISEQSTGQYITRSFPYIFQKEMGSYLINIGATRPIDKLQLVCNHFSLPLPIIHSQQFVPFSAFPFSNLTEQEIREINNNPNQNCRIFGHKDTVLTSVSTSFNLFYPSNPLKVFINNTLFKEQENIFYPMVKGLYNNNEPEYPLYHYQIQNPHSYPMYLMINAYKANRSRNEGEKFYDISNTYFATTDIFKDREELTLDFYELYYNYKDEVSFYSHYDGLDVIIGKIVTKGEVSQDYIYKEIEFKGKKQKISGLLIKMEPQSEIQFSTLLTSRFSLCEFKNQRIWLGGVVKYPDLQIHQLLTDRLEEMPYEKNLQHKLYVKAGKYFDIITQDLRYGLSKHKKNTGKNPKLWFTSSKDCDLMTYSKEEPVISIRIKGSQDNPRTHTRFQSFDDFMDYKGPSTPLYINNMLSTEIGWAKQEEEESQIVEDHKKKVKEISNNQQASSYPTPPDFFLCGDSFYYGGTYGGIYGGTRYTQCP